MSHRNAIPEPRPEAAAPLSRELRIDDLEDLEEIAFEASPKERADIADLLDLVALDALHFSGRLERQGERFFLRGMLTASLVQNCVVSLDPIESKIEAPIKTSFWPEPLVAAFARDLNEAAKHDSADWPEPILDGKIDLGPLLYETLATAIDPYPRRQDARLEWQDNEPGAPDQPEKKSPFAVLERLKKDA